MARFTNILSVISEIDRISEVEVDDGEVLEYIEDNYYPEDVFEDNELDKWARENGFVKKGE